MSLAATSSLPDTSPRLSFTLGDAFRGITICAVAAFAVTQIGPFGASRAIAVGLACCVAVLAWRRRRRGLWFAAAGIVLLGFLPTILAAVAPFSQRDLACSECGRSRDLHQVCGWTTLDATSETEASRWAASRLPADHTHQWVTTSHYYRLNWFGSAPIGCGGMDDGAWLAWQFARLGDQQSAEECYQEYCDIRRGKSTKPLKQHRAEWNVAFDKLLQAKRP